MKKKNNTKFTHHTISFPNSDKTRHTQRERDRQTDTQTDTHPHTRLNRRSTIPTNKQIRNMWRKKHKNFNNMQVRFHRITKQDTNIKSQQVYIIQ
jgi:hypothetical protein